MNQEEIKYVYVLVYAVDTHIYTNLVTSYISRLSKYKYYILKNNKTKTKQNKRIIKHKNMSIVDLTYIKEEIWHECKYLGYNVKSR